jgi:hypothetical protein
MQSPSFFQSAENSYIHRLKALRQVEFGKSAITIYNFERHEVLTAVLMNMAAMIIHICIPLQEPASAILRAVQEKHTPWTTMNPNAASSSKTITPTYQATLQCIPDNWKCVFISWHQN